MSTRVAAVQLPFAYFDTPQEFADHIRPRIEQAAQDGAQLILLPHLASFMLFGMFDPGARATDSIEQFTQRQDLPTPEWLGERAGFVLEFYLHLFQSLAARVEAWLAPGTALEADNGAVYLTSFLMNPAGEIVGRQRQLHPGAQETTWGVSHGDALRVFGTEIGDFGILIGSDICDEGVARTLVLSGANILLHPAADSTYPQGPGAVSTRGDECKQAVGAPDQGSQELWRAAQANQLFAVQANLVGGNYRGRSAIYAPAALTVDGRGILVRAKNNSDGEIVFADLEIMRP